MSKIVTCDYLDHYFQINLFVCCFLGDIAKSEQLYQEMLDQSFRPNAATYAVRIRTYLTA